MASAQGGRGDDDVERSEPGVGVTARQPGHELAQARARRGIDLAEMAARLHLPERQLDALERDDYHQLPPPAFVRGYLRAYAREVGLDGDDIVGAYDALGPAAEDPEIRPLEKSSRVASARATIASLVVLIGVVAAAFGGWLWQSQQGGGEPGTVLSSGDAAPADDSGGDTASTQATTAGSGDAGAADASGASDGDESASAAERDSVDGDATAAAAAEQGPSTGTTGDADDAPESDSAAVTDQTAEPAPEATGSSADGAPAQAPSRSGAEPGEADAPAETQSPAASAEPATDASAGDATASLDEAASDETSMAAGETAEDGQQAYDPPSATSSAERATAPAAADGPDTLELEVAGRSWIEVYDDRGRQLVYTLYTGEAPLRLRGWAPFDVFLGNSPDVRIRYGGEAVTKSAFTRSDQTARFLVDADGARRR